MTGSYTYDPQLGYIPSVPLPWYCWQFWKWQKVRCQCGATFISSDLGMMPLEYKRHWVLTHMAEVEPRTEWLGGGV